MANAGVLAVYNGNIFKSSILEDVLFAEPFKICTRGVEIFDKIDE